jgi:hypothetical protein
MKKSELRQLIKEEILKITQENNSSVNPIKSFKISLLKKEFEQMGFPISKIEAYEHWTAGPVLAVEFKNSIDIDEFYNAYEELQFKITNLPDISDSTQINKNEYLFHVEK